MDAQRDVESTSGRSQKRKALYDSGEDAAAAALRHESRLQMKRQLFITKYDQVLYECSIARRERKGCCIKDWARMYNVAKNQDWLPARMRRTVCVGVGSGALCDG